MPIGTATTLPQVKGLDVARGLRLFAGQAAVYRESLQEFARLYGAGLPRVESYLDSPTDDHLAQARHEVHAVGGAAAALGASVIEQLAQEFETRARRPPGEAADAALPLAGLRRELALLTGALRAQLEGT